METSEQMSERWAREIKAAGAQTEDEMREAEAPWPESIEELSKYVESLTDRPHDYGTCVYAMSLAAVAAYQFVAKKLGVTGFQASVADFDIIRRTRSIEGPFGIIQAHDMLYPQYDLQDKVNEWIQEWHPWAREEAKKLLEEEREFPVAGEVEAHWKTLAASA